MGQRLLCAEFQLDGPDGLSLRGDRKCLRIIVIYRRHIGHAVRRQHGCRHRLTGGILQHLRNGTVQHDTSAIDGHAAAYQFPTIKEIPQPADRAACAPLIHRILEVPVVQQVGVTGKRLGSNDAAADGDVLPGGVGRPRLSLRACRSHRTLRACRSHRTLRPLRALDALLSLRACISLVSLCTGSTCRTGVTLVPLGAGIPFISLRSAGSHRQVAVVIRALLCVPQQPIPLASRLRRMRRQLLEARLQLAERRRDLRPRRIPRQALRHQHLCHCAVPLGGTVSLQRPPEL